MYATCGMLACSAIIVGYAQQGQAHEAPKCLKHMAYVLMDDIFGSVGILEDANIS